MPADNDDERTCITYLHYRKSHLTFNLRQVYFCLPLFIQNANEEALRVSIMPSS